MGPEIQAKLGVDTSSVATDLAGAKNIFNKWGSEVANSGSGHGADFGGKLVKSIEHKIGGAHLGTAIASALGFNVEKIADKIAEFVVGGSSEAWKEAEKLADESTKQIADLARKNLKGENLAASLEKELADIANQIEAIQKRAKTHLIDQISGGGDVKSLDAGDRVELEKAEQRQRDVAAKLAEEKKAAAEEQKKYEEDLNALAAEALNTDGKIIAATLRKHEIEKELGQEGILVADAHKLTLELLKQENTIKELGKKRTDEEAEAEKKKADAAEKAQKDEIARQEKLFNLKREQFTQGKKLEDDQNKLSDRSKLTVGELANLQGGKKDFSLGKSNLDLSFGSNQGLTSDQEEAKKKAQKIQELEAEGEAKRLSGDQAGSEQAFGKVGQLRDELVGSGATKSSEGDKFGDLRKQIAEDNKIIKHTLDEILKVESGKFVSQ